MLTVQVEMKRSKTKSSKGNDVNFGDSTNCASTADCSSGDDKINAGQGDNELTGGGADKFKCGGGDDTVFDYNPDEGDKITENCETIL